MKGVDIIAQALPNMPTAPGVYKMTAAGGKPLYIGKARNLKKRVQSYTKPERQSVRIQRMIAAVENLEIITTHTEAEALLLEANLIKKLKPRYNILLRDDKSYPMILIRRDHEFPQIIKHRGAQTTKGDYFGPFAGTQAVNQTLTILQKAFLLRNCSDSVFRNRARPCLQYFIKRCSAPCVGKIAQRDYGDLVEQANAFLQGKSRDIQDDLSRRMQKAGDDLDFEAAAVLRDRIKALNSVQSRQTVNLGNLQDADIVALAVQDGICCVQVFFYRGGRNYGNRTYFPAQSKDMEAAEILSSFIAQFYTNKPAPKMILCSHKPSQADWLEAALGELAETKVSVSAPVRGERKAAVDFAATNAREALKVRLADAVRQQALLERLAELLEIDTPRTIEVYDNSHLQGSDSVGAMIAVNAEGFDKKRYRKFNIKQAAHGDDYAMMREVIGRRFKRAMQQEEAERAEGAAGGGAEAEGAEGSATGGGAEGSAGGGAEGSATDGGGAEGSATGGGGAEGSVGSAAGGSAWDLPDLIVLDGGKGQLSAAEEALAALDMPGLDGQGQARAAVPMMAVAKGADRHAGREVLYLQDGREVRLPKDDALQFFIQRIRDESHRFVIGAHRQKRGASALKSQLDDIPEIGRTRRRKLLLHFGSLSAIANAAVEDLCKVEGISRKTAEKVYDFFHG